MFGSIKTIVTVGLMANAFLWPLKAFAGSATLYLVRSTLSNDADADGGGLWQYEGGSVQDKTGAAVGTYILQRRVTTSGTSAYNTAGESISLFFAPASSGALPPGITLEGDYSYNSGAVSGSVSAADSKYHWIIGADAAGSLSNTNNQARHHLGRFSYSSRALILLLTRSTTVIRYRSEGTLSRLKRLAILQLSSAPAFQHNHASLLCYYFEAGQGTHRVNPAFGAALRTVEARELKQKVLSVQRQQVSERREAARVVIS